eukprot:CAMPEP_0185766154 /NCGR_PEP_ID=MMETSP1174-20130828/35722_1 /TAXON_ID=35687 /ORGANISM="Dictyocha speculum, Strain CCMP1381" /LENGTH=275 /DNA_ID=CAMNT_0028449683 /DNA_START=26 /DNA_END=853 /DNA_ORIENTATION=-
MFAARRSLTLSRNVFRGASPLQPTAYFHSSPLLKVEEPVKEEPAPVQSGSIVDRFTTTAEVTVSKLFPAGFGWQASSILADGMGYGATDVPFFLITGGGDFAGVMIGHTGYYAIKKAVYDPSINIKDTAQTGLWLATAAFCSGAAWQPIVNMWQGVDAPFNAVFAGAWAGCGFMFYAGLRAGRAVYPFMPDADYDNLVADATLSASIGGATGFFVGTDAAYMDGAGNWLRPVIGVEDADSDIVGCLKAGTSTGLGFFVAQGAQNVVYPSGKCWLD